MIRRTISFLARPNRIQRAKIVTRNLVNVARATSHELEHLYPILAHGSVLILDDDDGYRGAQKAADEYFASRPFLMNRIDEHVRCGVKI